MTKNKSNEFRVGDLVSWEYHVNDKAYAQEGKIVAILYPGQVPCPIKYPSMYVRHKPGGPRKHISYIIQGKPVEGHRVQSFYWPIVSRLNLVRAAPVPKERPVDSNVTSFIKAELSFKESVKNVAKPKVSNMPNPTKMRAVSKNGLTVTGARQWLQALEKEGMGGQVLVVAHGNLNKIANLAPSGEVMGFYSGLGWNSNKVFAMTPTPVGVEWDELTGIRSYMSKLLGTTEAINKQLEVINTRKITSGLRENILDTLSSIKATTEDLERVLLEVEAAAV